MTSPIAKAIAERLWPVTRSPQTPVEQEMYDIATRFVRGDFDDLLPAYTTEVATVGNTRYLMPSEPPTSWWRMVAVMRERLRAGESVESVAADYSTPEDVVTMLADAPAGRPVLSDDVIDALTDTIRNMTGHDSAADFYDSCGQAARPGDEPIPYSRIAAELRAWEKEGGT